MIAGTTDPHAEERPRSTDHGSSGGSFRATVLTLHPGMFPGPLGLSLAGDALARGDWTLQARDIREHGLGAHHSVDDAPFGGGPGMVLRPDVLAAAIRAAAPEGDPRPRILMTPRGEPLGQARVRALSEGAGVVIVCGRFEGVDERVVEACGLEEVAVADAILSGGELAAMLLLDACVRLLPGVMGHEGSGVDESFEAGLLEYPHYTRPATWEGRAVPDVLLSGDHAAIARWRRLRALADTRARRPDLFGNYVARLSQAVDKRGDLK